MGKKFPNSYEGLMGNNHGKGGNKRYQKGGVTLTEKIGIRNDRGSSETQHEGGKGNRCINRIGVRVEPLGGTGFRCDFKN